MKTLTKTSRVAGYLEKIYRIANQTYFESALLVPVITIQSTPNAYGHISIGNRWKVNGEGKRELNIGAGTLNRPIEEVVATMLHEMCHEWNLIHNIKDTSNGNVYHNKKFKATAEEKAHLIIEHHDCYGWTITHPSEETFRFCLDNDLSEIRMNRTEFDFFVPGDSSGAGSRGKDTGNTEKPKTKSSTRKYICPNCGQSVRATKVVQILCGICSKPEAPITMITA